MEEQAAAEAAPTASVAPVHIVGADGDVEQHEGGVGCKLGWHPQQLYTVQFYINSFKSDVSPVSVLFECRAD